MKNAPLTVGIDLGTTNSAVAFIDQGRPQLIPIDGDVLMPSVVALDPDDRLLVGHPARNQYLLYPERTIRSVKRRMGSSEKLVLAGRELSPEEASAAILARLAEAARAHLGRPVDAAVITVPAFFSDAQRSATRAAGEIAGLQVARIINEPTAAALCYVPADTDRERLVLVYDLGGGTFDVSIVRIGAGIMEVLASHGDTALGGDDFDRILGEYLLEALDVELDDETLADPRLRARLSMTAERAKIQLSTESFVEVAEEHLALLDGRPVHLDVELTRGEYVDLIEPWLQRTTDSVSIALREAGVLARDLDEVLLVGGASRTPRVSELLYGMLGRMPRADVDPDRAVAIGAAIQADRLAGGDAGPVLVDVTPYSFGTSHLGLLDGYESPHCYKVIVPRNTPLPTRKTEIFYTVVDGQEAVSVKVYQGEQADARANLPIGQFMVNDLDQDAAEGSPILFDLALDLDGILKVTVTEKHTGLKKAVVIKDALRKLSERELGEAQDRVTELIETGIGRWTDPPARAEGVEAVSGQSQPPPPVARLGLAEPPDDLDEAQRSAWNAACVLVERGRIIAGGLSDIDRQEVEGVLTGLTSALRDHDIDSVQQLSDELGDILFYLE